MPDLINWGIIGPGRIAHTFAQAFPVVPDGKLYAVASRNAKKAKDFASRYNIPRVFSSYEEMLNDPKVDMVYIATPHRFHYQQVVLCLEAGKSVLCEKPLTVNAAEAEKLITLAKSKGLFLMEALWTRFLPIYGLVREWLDQKLIGKVRLLDSTFGSQAPGDVKDRWYNPELAGGVLLDMGVYNLSISQWVMGTDPEAFQAFSQLSNTGIDETTAAILQYKGGAVSQFTCSFLTNAINDFLIYGDKGYIRIHSGFWESTQATLVIGDKETTEMRPLAASGFEGEIQEAMRCYREGKLESSDMPLAQTLKNMVLMDDIRQLVGVKYPFE